MKRLTILIAALAAASLACTFSVNLPNIRRIETGPTETLEIREALPEGQAAGEVTLELPAGSLRLAGGAAEAFVEGTIDYNVAAWQPSLSNADGQIRISQDEDVDGLPDDDVVNLWDLRFGQAPMKLTVNAGAYDGQFDFTGLALRAVDIAAGAGNVDVKFDKPNPAEMERFVFRAGASQVTLAGLGHANFETLEFKGGAGDYTLDFSGELRRDAQVDISLGVGNLQIEVPEGLRVVIDASTGVGAVDTRGKWTVDGTTYRRAGEGPRLTISVSMGVGSLTLIGR